MINNLFRNNYHFLISLSLLLSVYLGFFLDENITQGPKIDFEHALKQVAAFEKDFKFSFLNFDKIEQTTRISPIFISIIFFLKKFLIEIDLVRFVLMNIILLNQLVFFYCLKNSKINEYFDDKTLFLISSSIYLSPSFRANSIWPESAMLGLLFFLLSTYFYLKFKKNLKLKFVFLNIFFLSIASYIRPSFCLFAIFFSIEYLLTFYKQRYFYKKLFLIFFSNLFLAFPAIYYVFVLDIFFIRYGGLSDNYFNKFSIISSIIMFHLIPILYIFKNEFKLKDKVNIIILFLSILSLIVIFFKFDYNLDFAGGGIILHLSQFVFKNNIIFFIFYLFSVFFLLRVSFFKNFKNSIIYLILILITPQYHIFHKYYDPLVIILFLTIFEVNLKNVEKKKKFISISILSFYISLYTIHFVNNNFIS